MLCVNTPHTHPISITHERIEEKGDKEELFDYFKDVVFQDEEAEDWDSEEGEGTPQRHREDR